MTRIRTFFPSLALALSVSGGSLFAQQIHTGSDAGAYFNNICPAALDVIGSSPSDEALNTGGVLPGGSPLFFEHSCATSGGTVDNLAKVRANPGDLGVGQLDLVAQDADGLFVVNTGVSECLYVVSNNEAVASASQLNPRMPFGLPSKNSGSAATFLQHEPFSSLRRVTHYDSAIDAVNAVNNGDVAAAGFIQIPDTTNAVFEAAADLHFAGVVNRSMLRQTVGDTRVYEGTPNVQVSPGSWTQIFGAGDEAQTVTTSCTPVVIFGQHPDTLTGMDQTDMADLMGGLQRAATANLLVPDTGDWRSLFANLADRRRSAAKQVEDFITKNVSN
jgi:hypothetical protein